ncbi:MAG TPA: HAD-IA family hydrolase [Candidatus Saccharimonadales bacterium]|jgi:phosphoglycolate phosphatase|nr:HAD-IA family hydrolase [Candidatus Saccharimonadales bacterium]
MATIIFDFDGTLANSFALILATFHEITGRSKMVTPEEVVRLRHMPLLKAAEELHLPAWRVPFLVIKGRRAMRTRMDEVLPFGGIAEALETLHNDGYRLFIMSSNSTQNVRNFLKAHHLNTYFERVYGGVGLFGKARALKRVLRANRLDVNTCMYVGDEPRDIEGARRVGMLCIAVTWGFNTADLLKQHYPYVLVDEPEKLPAAIRKWSKTIGA